MTIQDSKTRTKIRLGAPVTPETKTIPDTGIGNDGAAPKLRSKISLSSKTHPQPQEGIATGDLPSSSDYRREDDYRTTSAYETGNPSPDPSDDDSFYADDIYEPDEFDYANPYSYDSGASEPTPYESSPVSFATTANDNPQAVAMYGYESASQKRKRLYRRVSIMFFGVFIVSGTLLALMLGTNWLKDKAYKDLSSDMTIKMKDGTTQASPMDAPDTPGRNWAELRAENPDIKYWMTVENKPIDYPLVQHESDQNFYLKHNFWGDYSTAGTPFIDVRNYAMTDKHLLTYGHHITGSETMYSTVNKAWKPEEFAEIGNLTLEFPDENDVTHYEIYYPAFAFMVDQSYQTIQTFDYADDADFRNWLRGMADEATSTNERTDYLVRNARRAVSFVTCASDTPNQRERTIIVFISVAAPSTSRDLAGFMPRDVADLAPATTDAPAQVAIRLNPVSLIAKKVPGLASTGGVIPNSPLLTGKPWR